MKEVPAVRPHPTVIVEAAIKSQESTAKVVAQFVARLLDRDFYGHDVVLDGEVRIAATVRDRATGERLGGAEIAVMLPIGAEHQPPTDQDTLEVSPGERHPDGVIG